MTQGEQEDLDTRLIDAAYWGHMETVQALLASGADLHADNDDALGLAAWNGHTKTVKALLASGADVHANDDYALYWAACWGHTETVKVLAKHIFVPESWRGKSCAAIDAYATSLYDKIAAYNPSNPIKPENLHSAATILADCAIDCWHQVRPPPPKLRISPLPAQPRPL
jgi:hypothetical protein